MDEMYEFDRWNRDYETYRERVAGYEDQKIRYRNHSKSQPINIYEREQIMARIKEEYE